MTSGSNNNMLLTKEKDVNSIYNHHIKFVEREAKHSESSKEMIIETGQFRTYSVSGTIRRIIYTVSNLTLKITPHVRITLLLSL